MLKKIRIILATIMFIGVTLLFVGIGHEWWGWMAKIQFLPSLLAMNVVAVAALCVLTLVFGRIYCSVICPMGIWQDIVNKISSLRKGKKRRFSFSPEKKWLRNGILAAYIICLIAGIQAVIALLAPYSAWGRIVGSIFHPHGVIVPVIAGVTCLVVTVLAWLGGRTYCNTICPVGTTLSWIARFSIFRPMIDESKCKGCHGCEKMCKASCIDSDNRKIDYSRCVTCGDCLENCKFGAIKYGNAYAKASEKPAESVDKGKRAFMAGAIIAGASAIEAKAQTKVDGGFADVLPKKNPERSERLVPPGSKSVKSFYDHCTACQLCVSACPNGVLRPSTDLSHLMQPQMGYENGFCRPECSECSQVCPAGAILPVTPEEKTAIHIGHATVNYDLCVVNTDGVSCGNCSRHCPAGAIRMVPKDANDPRSPKIPTVIEDRCIGCGECEFLCPARPLSAIHVDGLSTHIND